LIHEFQSLTPEIETGWGAIARPHRCPAAQPTPARRCPRGILGAAEKRPAVATLATAQVAFVAIGATILQWSSQPTYVALGSAPVAGSANVIVMFRPEAREADLRGALATSGAALVGGTDRGRRLSSPRAGQCAAGGPREAAEGLERHAGATD
jgi:hypothetical protein